jgi:hypothetical protein
MLPPPLARACTVLLLASPVWAAPQQRPTFRSTANGVLVNAFVLTATRSSTKPVLGLTGADFDLTDNGQRQVVDAAPADGPIDVTLVVDGSGDASRYVGQFRQTVHDLAASLRPTDRVRLLVCAGVVREAAPMQSAATPLPLDQIGVPNAPYGPALVHGLFDAMVHEADPDRRQVVLSLATFTGRDIFGPGALVSVASASDAVVYVAVVPSGTPIFADTFQSLGEVVSATGGALLLAGDPNGRFGLPGSFRWSPNVRGASGGAMVGTFKNLKAVAALVVDDLHQGYVLSYNPPGGTVPGWHDISVRVIKPGTTRYIVRARKRYLASSDGPVPAPDTSGPRRPSNPTRSRDAQDR